MSNPTAADLVATERERQIEVLGYDAAHDDGHANGEMRSAAVAYILRGERFWPWQRCPVFRSDIENLVKAAALLDAEIERLQRLNERGAGG